MLKGQDAWRNHAVFTGLWKHAFPGLKYGALAFGVFCLAELTYDMVMHPKAPTPHKAGEGAPAKEGPS